jgi:hypothetical protein
MFTSYTHVIKQINFNYFIHNSFVNGYSSSHLLHHVFFIKYHVDHDNRLTLRLR